MKESPHETALHAWGDKRTGTFDLNGQRIVKDKKTILVIYPATEEIKTGFGYFPVVGIRIEVFPKPEHMSDFKKASTWVDPMSAGYLSEGSIGSIGIRFSETNALLLRHTGHFVSGDEYTPVTKGRTVRGEPIRKFTSLPRKFATLYNGWRVRALRAAIALAQEKGVPFVVDHRYTHTGKWSSKQRKVVETPLVKDLTKAVESLTAKMSKNGKDFPTFEISGLRVEKGKTK